MDRYNFYYRQKVTEAEMDDAFDDPENADHDMVVDNGFVGIVQGLNVTESATPGIEVDVTVIDRSVAYDQLGQRIAVSTDQDVDCSVDENSNPTAVTTPGNERWLSIFIEFVRAQSDLRIDGNGNPVYYRESESFQINVAAGTESAPPATKPALRNDQILLADTKLIYGQTQILNADIDFSRRQSAFVATETRAAVVENTAEEAVQSLTTQLDETIAMIGRLCAFNLFRETDVAPASSEIHDIAYSPNPTGSYRYLHVIVGDDGTTTPFVYVSTSGEGSVWVGPGVFGGTPEKMNAALWDTINDLFIIGGVYSAANGAEIETSPDGVTWTFRNPFGMASANDVIYDLASDVFNGYVVAVGGNGTNGRITRSANGTSWVSATTNPVTTMADLKAVAANDTGTLVAVGASLGGASPRLCYSIDGGDNWTVITTLPGSGGLNAIVWDQLHDLFIAVGDAGQVHTSSDGITWADRSVTTATNFESISVDNRGVALVCGGYISPHTTILITSDGAVTFQEFAAIQELLDLTGGKRSRFQGGRYWIFQNASRHLVRSLRLDSQKVPT